MAARPPAVDLLVAVGDHANDIAVGAREAGLDLSRVHLASGADEVVALLEPHLDGAVVLVKASRGLALEQVVAALVDGAAEGGR